MNEKTFTGGENTFHFTDSQYLTKTIDKTQI